MTEALVVERFGLRLSPKELATALGLTVGAIYNQISAGTFPVKTYLDSGKRWADYRHVAEHLDNMMEHAT